MRTTQQMLAITEVGDKWINENGAVIEHKREGIKWLTNRSLLLNWCRSMEYELVKVQ